MLRNIRIDDEVWRELEKRARPFVDSPNDVLRREFKLEERQVKRRTPAEPDRKETESRARGNRTQENEFYIPILETLVESGGRERVSEILKSVYAKTRERLTEWDLGLIKSGQIRWEVTARFARKQMTWKQDPPLLNPSAPFGWWEVTEAGREYLKGSHNAIR